MSRRGTLPSCDFTASEKTEIYSTLPERAAVSAPKRRKNKRLFYAALAAFIILAGMMFATVWQQMELYTLTAKEEQLSGELERLRSRRSTLQVQYEELFDLQRLESIARDELGMCRPGRGQMIRLELDEDDEPEEKSGSMTELCNKIRAYFRHWR